MERSRTTEAVRDEERRAAIERIAAAAPPLTAEQIVALRRVFHGTGTRSAARHQAAA
ncbi:hypothetical protein ACWEQG_01470 [Microbispora sp. NPDC004025]